MTTKLCKRAAILWMLACGAGIGAAQEPLQEPAELEHLEYRSIGPARGGRVSRVAGVPGDPSIYYAATASGGVWKSVDGGISFKPIFDDQPISSIGSIAVAPSDPNVIYVGSGEANIRGNVAAGNGIYKSTDAGATWSHVWKQKGQIGTMIVHPGNPDIAFAAVLGHAFGPNPERGVYRTRDGGKSWEQVLKKDADTGASDVCFDPNNPHTLFAGMWQARRRPWELTSGGPGSGLYVSRDGGDRWEQLTGSGLPEGIWGKVGVAVAPSDSRRVYALIEAEHGGLYRSDDGGKSWELASAHHALRQRAWYYSTITVDPESADVLWCPQVPMLRSIDGGKSFLPVRGIHHGDHHDLWIDPLDRRRMIGANDGGVDVSIDGGESWHAAPLPIGQFYHITTDSRVPYTVAGALQDLGTAAGPSNSLHSAGIRSADWHDVGGGEAGYVQFKPDDPDIAYAGEYLGIITRHDRRSGQSRIVSLYPDNGSGHGAADLRYRFQWTAPIAVSPHDPEVVYHAANILLKSSDGGQSWSEISPDLTRDDESKQQWSGGPITGDNTGVEFYCTIFAVAESPLQKDLIWAGTDDGLVQVTEDGGHNWRNVTAAIDGLPEWGTISMIEPSYFDARTAFVVVDAHRLDDMRPHLFKTTDLGRTWTSLTGGLPQDVYLHAVREDPVQRGMLYLGTERGVAYSQDGGASWQALKLNLPTVAVHDLAVKGDDLVVGTHGRSAWIFDDLAVLRQLTPEALAGDLHLFESGAATRWRYAYAPRDKTAGENPPEGAALYYFIKQPPEGELTIEILDAQGALVRKLSSIPEPSAGDQDFQDPKDEEERRKAALQTEAGIHRAVWDLAHEGATKIQGGKIDMGDPATGPMALPGRYTIRLSADGKEATGALELRPDPRVQVSDQDLQAQLDFSLKTLGDINRLSGLVEQLRSVREQLRERSALIEDRSDTETLRATSQQLIEHCDRLEAVLHNPKAEVTYDILAQKGGTQLYSRYVWLYESGASGAGAPTQGVGDVYAELSAELERHAAELDAIRGELEALNRSARELGIPHIVLPASGG